VLVSLGQRILGRTTGEDVKDLATGEVVVPADTYLDEEQVERVERAGVTSVKIRSVLICEAEQGVCAACYGRDLARGTRVNIGEAVGVIAAQSIGEPGTQLTMRTFHIGGTAQVAETSFFESSNDGQVKFTGLATVQAADGDLIVMTRNGQVSVTVDGKERESYKPPYGARLKVKEGDTVKKGQRLAMWDPYTNPIISETGGRVRLEDLVDGLSVREETDEATGIANRVVIDWRASPRGSDLRPAMGVLNAEGGYNKLASGGDAAQLAAGGRHPLGGRRRRGPSGRRPGAGSDRGRQDPRHHRGSAPRGGAVRSAPAQGLRGHRRDGRPRHLREGLQEQAPDQDHP
jgi:DNA-directed RNA polymerase subunit beta'